MKKNVLIITSSNDPRWGNFEQAILAKGLQLLRVSSIKEALYRIENEFFSVIVFEDSIDGKKQKEFAEGLENLPLGLTTPIVIMGPNQQPSERVLLSSLLDQYFPVSTEPELLAEYISETHELRKQKAKRGKIGSVSVPQLLYQVSRLRMSCAVVVERVDEKYVVYIENGNVIFASSNRDENRFGEFLVTRGIVNRNQLIHAIRLLEKGDKRLGRILVDEGFLKPQVLQTLLQLQIKHIVFAAFDWNQGEFYILPDEPCEQDSSIARVDMAGIIMEGVRLKLTESYLNTIFTTTNTKISLALPFEEIQKRLRMGKDETDFLKIIGNGREFHELTSLNSYSRLESLKLIYAFKVLGLLSFQKIAPVAPKETFEANERLKMLGELFQERPIQKKVVDLTVSPHPKPKGWRLGYVIGAGTMGIAIAVFLVLFTLLDTRSSREGQTADSRRIVVPNLVIETGQIQVVRAPEVGSPLATAIPAMTPTPTPTSNPVTVEKTVVDPIQGLFLKAGSEKKTGRMHDALATYRKILELDPNHVESMIEIGEILFDLDRTKEAMDILERAVVEDPENPRPHLTIGTIYMMRSQKEKAKRAYQKFLSLAPASQSNRPRITEVKRILQNLETEN